MQPEHLGEWLSLGQIEARERVHDPLGAVPALAFGHLNGAWHAWRETVGEDTRCRAFCADWRRPWGGLERIEGYFAIHDGTIGPHFVSAARELDPSARD